jgi:hypothetical protein
MPDSSRSTTRAALMTWVVVVMYRRIVSLGFGEARTGGLEMSALSWYVAPMFFSPNDIFT